MTNPTPERQNHAESVVIYRIGNTISTPERQNHAESAVIYRICKAILTPENKNLAESMAAYQFFQANFFYGKNLSKRPHIQVLISTWNETFKIHFNFTSQSFQSFCH